jgi:hypothetical protein
MAQATSEGVRLRAGQPGWSGRRAPESSRAGSRDMDRLRGEASHENRPERWDRRAASIWVPSPESGGTPGTANGSGPDRGRTGGAVAAEVDFAAVSASTSPDRDRGCQAVGSSRGGRSMTWERREARTRPSSSGQAMGPGPFFSPGVSRQHQRSPWIVGSEGAGSGSSAGPREQPGPRQGTAGAVGMDPWSGGVPRRRDARCENRPDPACCDGARACEPHSANVLEGATSPASRDVRNAPTQSQAHRCRGDGMGSTSATLFSVATPWSGDRTPQVVPDAGRRRELSEVHSAFGPRRSFSGRGPGDCLCVEPSVRRRWGFAQSQPNHNRTARGPPRKKSGVRPIPGADFPALDLQAEPVST